MDQSLLLKIRDLFEYRDFPSLYSFSGLPQNEIEILNQKLIELQASIYYLDHYLETNWDIKQKDLNYYWKNIHAKLDNVGIANNEWMEYTNHILKYQKHEVELRQAILPTRLDMEYFYFYKSCDVKLIRRLLLKSLPTVSKLFSQADWRYFDLITEVNDDVTDIEEDLATINGNRVLISLQQYGAKKTIEDFTLFIDQIMKKSKGRFQKGASSYKLGIHKKTLENCEITRALLKKNVATFEHNATSELSKNLEIRISA